MWGIDFKEESTKRAIVWFCTAVIGTIAYFIGRDITPIILLGTAVAGGLGIVRRDYDGK